MELRRIGITWPLSDSHGWGVFGLNLALNLIRNGPTTPILFVDPQLLNPTEQTIAALTRFVQEGQQIAAQIQPLVKPVTFNEAVLIHVLYNDFTDEGLLEHTRGHHNVGFIFFENGEITPDAARRAAKWDRILVGSTWNEQLCKAAGIDDVVFVSQGIDTDLFKPAPPGDQFQDRFVIFSGGKFELRKGQDIVLEAFKRFHQRHPDSLLITAWQNHWPATIGSMMESPFVASLPGVDSQGKLMIEAWAVAHGLPADAIVDSGWVANAVLPELLHQANVALFPNRAEGGTNLAAMEAMACGIPCILSANSGHLDLLDDDNCYVLQEQTPGRFTDDPGGHWRSSSVDEILEKLEAAYVDSEARKRRGGKGADFMKQLSWKNQVAKIVTAIEDFL